MYKIILTQFYLQMQDFMKGMTYFVTIINLNVVQVGGS